MTGGKYGRMLVLRRTENSRTGRAMWLCRCNCGVEKSVEGQNLRTGATKSCGCLDREKFIERFTKHGEAHKTTEWEAWVNMRSRCFNPGNTSYPNYGGRGISVYKGWVKSYETFITDMGRCPSGWTLDRKNNDGDYTPSNCKWSTRAEQMRNTRRNVMVEYNGEKMVQKDFANMIGAKQNSLQAFLKTHTLEQAAEYYGGCAQ